MREYFLAVDGGGSKTEFCLSECATGETRHFSSGGTNYKISETDADAKAFREGIHRLFQETGIRAAQVRGMVMGMAGVDSAEDSAYYLQIGLQTGIPPHKIYVCNDSEIAFYSKGAPPGLCVIAGTGSVSTGFAPDRRMARSGGWGSPVSDEGSGAWLGIKVLSSLLRYCDGYGTYHKVYEDIKNHFAAASFFELPKILSLIGVSQTAAAARIVMDSADGGDAYCGQLVRQAAGLVAQIACSVYKKLHFETERSVDVVMAGSLFKSMLYDRVFTQALKNLIPKDNLRFCREVFKPVLGGIALAKNLFA